jgi:selenocysteine lyase/cysteine desulfurase
LPRGYLLFYADKKLPLRAFSSNLIAYFMVSTPSSVSLEQYFSEFRAHIIGQDQHFEGPYGRKRILYADWTASGRLYRPIEERLSEVFGPMVGNTHTETNQTGTTMTLAYHEAKHLIKKHVHAGPSDCLIAYGSGMTGVINKFQRILNFRIPERWRNRVDVQPEERPIVLVTHMEHHSNQTSWLETICDLEVIGATPEGLVDLQHLETLLHKYRHRSIKIAAVTAASNVTGITTPYHRIAAAMHRHGGKCFVDFACSAPYVHIDMHPEDPEEKLDAIYFSPHKFLGGPGTPGILIFDAEMYTNRVPDNPGGGTVKWTNPWKEHAYIDDIEEREDGGTPPFLQTIKTALCVQLKEKMGVENILRREAEMLERLLERLDLIPGLRVFARQHSHRLGVVSFIIEGLHYNLGVRLLNDRFGIQVRGGCSCAGTYGHYLLNVDEDLSHTLTEEISQGNLQDKPGWIRMSIHPTMTDAEIDQLADALEMLAKYHASWADDYRAKPRSNDFEHKYYDGRMLETVKSWFEL